MIHSRLEHTDGNGAWARVVLVDFRKAFDLIDHQILAEKLSKYSIASLIVCWILDFLIDRKQRVKLRIDCLSEWVFFFSLMKASARNCAFVFQN